MLCIHNTGSYRPRNSVMHGKLFFRLKESVVTSKGVSDRVNNKIIATRNLIVEHNMRRIIALSKVLASKLNNQIPSIDREDLLQLGVVILTEVIDSIEQDRVDTFEQFTYAKMRGAMTDYIRDNSTKYQRRYSESAAQKRVIQLKKDQSHQHDFSSHEREEVAHVVRTVVKDIFSPHHRYIVYNCDIKGQQQSKVAQVLGMHFGTLCRERRVALLQLKKHPALIALMSA